MPGPDNAQRDFRVKHRVRHRLACRILDECVLAERGGEQHFVSTAGQDIGGVPVHGPVRKRLPIARARVRPHERRRDTCKRDNAFSDIHRVRTRTGERRPVGKRKGSYVLSVRDDHRKVAVDYDVVARARRGSGNRPFQRPVARRRPEAIAGQTCVDVVRHRGNRTLCVGHGRNRIVVREVAAAPVVGIRPDVVRHPARQRRRERVLVVCRRHGHGCVARSVRADGCALRRLDHHRRLS